MLNLDQLRADTPGVNNVIHFNNAGAALMPRVVLDTVVDHLEREAQIGAYEAAEEAGEQLEAVYDSIACLLNAQPHEIAVVENATRAWDMAFYSLPLARGDVILTSATEYASNYISYLQMKEQRGVLFKIIPNDEHGQVSVAALGDLLQDAKVKLISLPMIATNGGPVQPVEAIGALARSTGVWFLLDACQAAGHVPLNVKQIGCHMLSATSRKYLRGPRGVGFLYVEANLCQPLVPAFLDLHAATLRSPEQFDVRGDARRFENWEANVAAKLGMGAAIDYTLSLGLEHIWARIQQVAARLRERLAQVDGLSLQDTGLVKSGIVTFTLERREPNAIKQALAAHAPRINVSVSTFRSTMLDMNARGLSAVVRASVHAYNSEDEIEMAARAIERMAR